MAVKKTYRALSIRQPLAWLIAHGYRDVDNRSWATPYRGPILIHASVTNSKWHWYHANEVMIKHQRNRLIARACEEAPYPPGYEGSTFDEFGGIVGIAELVDCVSSRTCRSVWAQRKAGYCFVFASASPVRFVPVVGRLNIFHVDLGPKTLRKLKP